MVLLTISLIILGAFTGGMIDSIVARYPVFLFAGWKKEAVELLELDFHVHLVPRRQSSEKAVDREAFTVRMKRIKLRVLQVTTAILFAISGTWVGWGLQLSILVFVAILVVLSLIDLEHYFLPDQFVGVLLFAGLLVNTQSIFAVSLNSALWGVIVGYFALWFARSIYRRIRKQDCLGLGDCKLTAAIGAWVGSEMIFSAIAIAAVVSVCYFAGRAVLFNNERTARIAFGPWLAVGGLAALLYSY